MFGNASEGVVETLKNKAISINAHMFSLPTKYFNEDPALVKFYRPISTNKDRDGYDFVSTFEGNVDISCVCCHSRYILY